jgi:NAD+ kinase
VVKRSPIRSVGLCLKPDSPQAGAAARTLDKWLSDHGVLVALDHEAARWLGREGRERAALADATDLLVVLGGDGTLLAVAREVGTRSVPILGVNLGTLGFLAEVAPEEQLEVLERVIEGDFDVVPRMRLRVRAERDGQLLVDTLALNDAVINRSELSRLIDLETTADGVPVTTYHDVDLDDVRFTPYAADGLIVATPTGSTAYTLSAGGPILMPGSRVFVLTPICPHTLTQRPLVLSQDAKVEIQVLPREGTAQLTIDGQVGLSLVHGDRVIIEASRHPVSFVASPSRSRFDVLRAKLRWGAA